MLEIKHPQMFTRHFEVLFKEQSRRKPSVKITDCTNDVPQKLRNFHLAMSTWTAQRGGSCPITGNIQG